jgi:hypothetical protein
MMQGDSPCLHFDGEFCPRCFPPQYKESGLQYQGCTLALCKHGKPAKFPCGKCYLETIDEPKKEETITIKKSLWDEMLEYKKRIEILEEWNKTNQLVNFNQDKKIKILEKTFPKNFEHAKDLIYNGAQTHATILKLEEKINRLEKQQNEHYSQIHDVDGLWASYHEIMQKLKNIETGLNDFIRSANSRMEQLHMHKNYQIDENRKISRRVDELEILVLSLSQQNSVIKGCPKCDGREHMLEN